MGQRDSTASPTLLTFWSLAQCRSTLIMLNYISFPIYAVDRTIIMNEEAIFD